MGCLHTENHVFLWGRRGVSVFLLHFCFNELNSQNVSICVSQPKSRDCCGRIERGGMSAVKSLNENFSASRRWPGDDGIELE